MARRRGELNLRNIEVFRATMKLGTVTAAADALGTSQPTVTRELIRMEQNLGFALFERQRQRLVPTARAIRLYSEILQTYVGLEQINRFVAGLRGAGDEVLTVSTLPALSVALLPEVLVRLKAELPSLSIDIRTEDPSDESPVSGFDFDIGLIEGEFSSQTTEVTPICDLAMVAVLPENHPLADRSVLRPADFAGLPFISLGRYDPSRLRLHDVFDDAGVERHMSLDCQSATAICELVRRGLGVSIVNPVTALHYKGGGLVLRAFAPRIGFSISSLRPLNRPQIPSADRFVRCLTEVCAQIADQLLRTGLMDPAPDEGLSAARSAQDR